MFLAGTSPVTGIVHGSYQGNGAPEVFSTREVAYKKHGTPITPQEIGGPKLV